MHEKEKHRGRGCLIALFTLAGLLSLTALAGWLSNRNLPSAPEQLAYMTDEDKALAAEALHLKAALGDSIWPGFAAAEIPLLIFNAENGFLLGIEEAPSGWQPVEGDSFYGEAYYWRVENDPQAFAVPAGGGWAGSMSTFWELNNFLIDEIGSMAPGFLAEIIPYRLALPSPERYISGEIHETKTL
jgi:hypothetical protein